jgi:hypothetical protein
MFAYPSQNQVLHTEVLYTHEHLYVYCSLCVSFSVACSASHFLCCCTASTDVCGRGHDALSNNVFRIFIDHKDSIQIQ